MQPGWEKLEEACSWSRNLTFIMFNRLCSRKERTKCLERVVAGKRHLSDVKLSSGGLHSETDIIHKYKLQAPPR